MSRIDEQLTPHPPLRRLRGAPASPGRADSPDAPSSPAAAEANAPAKGRAATPPFALRADEPLATGIARVAGEQIDAVTARLRAADGVSAKDVHESRKSLKRLRALSRLLRCALGPERYQLENGALRDSARHLAGARDAEVMVATLDALLRDDDCGRARGEDFATLRTHLLAERERAGEHLHADTGPARAAAAELDPVRRRTATWLGAEADFAAIEPGLRRLYGEGRERYRAARRKPTAERLHEWRKRVKDLRYCAELLAPIDADRLAELSGLADRLGEALGDEHDLTVLEAFASAHRDLFATPSEHKHLRKLIRRRRAGLRRQAMRLGGELYTRRPRRFTDPLVQAAAIAAPGPR